VALLGLLGARGEPVEERLALLVQGGERRHPHVRADPEAQGPVAVVGVGLGEDAEEDHHRHDEAEDEAPR